jgi:NADH-quinone oxidoreductase subunit C
MTDLLERAAQALVDRFDAQRADFRGEVHLILPAEKLIAAAIALRDELEFNMLSSETAVDYWPETSPRFHVVYQFFSTEHAQRICLRVPVDGDDPSLPTMESVHPNANWYEREVYDLFGITFEGHSDLRRLLLPYDWEGHPLRKDFPLGYEEVQFTFNYDSVDDRKPRPEA